MTKFTFKQSFSVLPSMQPAYDLFRKCESFDGYMPKLYWHSLHERQFEHNAFDYFCFDNEKLVGMLNILFFSDVAEFTVLVDPDYRGQKIFKKLLNIALAKLKGYVVSEYILISPFDTCKQEGATLDHHEVEMRAPEAFKKPEAPLTLIRATVEDIDVLAEIHVESFEKPGFDAIKQRFSGTLLEPNRKAYLAQNAEGEIVGKIHAREDFNRVYIHDVGIKKVFRQKGYGKALMLSWLSRYRQDYPDKPIAVEVLGNNTAALRLYEVCGFALTNTYYFWRFKI
jgi:ribosomal protein S18 acetylase RimI-like enzyme